MSFNIPYVMPAWYDIISLDKKNREVDIAGIVKSRQQIRDVVGLPHWKTSDICPKVVEFGPINATIHKIDECVALADIEPLARIYESTLLT